MEIEGRRIHIAGSAARDTDHELLGYAHELVRELVRSLGKEGATFALGVGGEPLADPGNENAPAAIFDWTALSTLHDLLDDSRVKAQSLEGRLVSTVATHKTEDQIPESRRSIWRGLRDADAVRLDYTRTGWTFGGVRREMQARQGDILVALSGGQGVEHLAQAYVASGKPVIPLDLNLGSSTNDGSGGAARLATEALTRPDRLLKVGDPEAAADLLSRTSTRNGDAPVQDIVSAVRRLILALEPPSTFYVRMLDESDPEFEHVERFFRYVVDPTVKKLGYSSNEMGRGATEQVWMNKAIYDALHRSSSVIVDFTGLRNNCFMEYGYALGRRLPVMLTARKGTKLPFDTSAIECHFWDDGPDDEMRIFKFEHYWRRNKDRSPLVEQMELP